LVIESKKPIVVLDTSFLINELRSRHDVQSALEELIGPHKAIVPLPVLEELRRRPREIGWPALVTCSGFEILPCRSRSADSCILRLASSLRSSWILATDDSSLLRSVRDMGVPVIYHSGKKLRLSFGKSD